MAEVRSQNLARATVEVAVAGGHGVLLAGPSGTGKTMVACRIPTLLPDLTRAEALETTKIYSAMGLAHGLIDTRPFRAPHYTISPAALIGGGSTRGPARSRSPTTASCFSTSSPRSDRPSGNRTC
jgi:magnesium chelatase family protein